MAQRLLCFVSDEKREQVSRDIYKAYWQEDRDVSDPNVLLHVATKHGINVDLKWFENPPEYIKSQVHTTDINLIS
jgi:2-hydroxychromene-2-carboxylate isomerase